MNYSRRQLEALGEPLGESVTRLKPGGRIYGNGGGGPTQTTVTQSNVPDWLRPQVETVLGGAMKELFQTQKVGGKPAVYDDSGNLLQAEVKPTYEITGVKPFTPYSTNMQDYVAKFSPLQQQVQANVANLQVPGQFNQATGLAGAAGMGGMQSAQQALGYGNAGFRSGQLGQQLGIAGGQRFGEMGAGYGQQAAMLAPEAQQYGRGAADIGLMGLRAEQYGRNVSRQAEDYAAQAAGMGDLYGQMATSPDVYDQYMSPYQQAVTDIQLAAAQRQADIARTQRSSRAARAGAFGGARQAIEEAEANRALASQLDAIQAQGLQNAFQQAQQNITQRAQLGLQGLSGAQQGLGTALQGGQLGLSGIGQAMQGQQAGLAGLQAANQLYGTGIQGAGMGLQGVQQQLAGTAQGMQGAGVGLQGVSGAQAGYGLANQAAGQLGQLGTQQLAAQTGILDLQNRIGAQQQAQEQQAINQAISNYAQAQQNPMERMQQFNALLRGYAVPGTTTAQYQAPASPLSQAAGAALTGTALANMIGKKKGGKIDSGEGIDKLAMRKALAGA